MGKRKAKAKKPSGPRKNEPLETTFTCLFCHHDKSVTIRIDRKDGLAQLVCRVCDQRYQGRVNHLTEPIDIYSEWIDAADAAQREERGGGSSTQAAPTPRPAARARIESPSEDEDDD